jgi:hypothetical protein
LRIAAVEQFGGKRAIGETSARRFQLARKQ